MTFWLLGRRVVTFRVVLEVMLEVMRLIEVGDVLGITQ